MSTKQVEPVWSTTKPIPKPGYRVVKKRIVLWPGQRYWYRVVDFVQPKWQRFAYSRWAYWLGRALRLLGRTLFWIGGAIFIVGFSVLYIFLRFAFGGIKLTRRR